MANENGEWIMRGLDWDNPYRIRTWQELINWGAFCLSLQIV